jgi:Transcription factor WhiB
VEHTETSNFGIPKSPQKSKLSGRIILTNRGVDTEFMGLARCLKSNDTNAFFPSLPHKAKNKIRYFLSKIKPVRDQYCSRCPVREQCFIYGIKTRSEGIYGGCLLLGKGCVYNAHGRNIFLREDQTMDTIRQAYTGLWDRDSGRATNQKS